jgi:TolA-binding protein
MYLRRILAGSAMAVALLALTAGGANAQSKIQQLQDQIQDLQSNYQNQIQGLQTQINQLKEQQRQQAEQAEVVRQQAAQVEAEYKKASSGLGGTYHIGGVTLKVGGFIESATIYRSSNQTSDVATGLNTAVPMGANTNSHLNEFRESARQSRLSLLATGQPDEVTNLTAYFETDFLGMASTANSNQSNSYNLRMRQAFAEYDRKDWGFSLAGGQMWSLATLETSGLYPRNEAVPLTIDANYNVGFNWLRVPQMRFIENFAPGIWGAVSVESPQAVNINNTLPAAATPGVLPSGDVITGMAGGSGGLLGGGGNTQTYSIDPVPDVIAKAAWEPGWGHFEIYGIGREFRTNVIAGPIALQGHQTAFAGGIGAGAVLPVMPKLVDVTATVLWGDGIGKYGDAQLSDYTVNANGQPSPNHEITGLLGVIGHVHPRVDLYGYWGIEHAFANSFNNTAGTAHFGYGNPLNSDIACTAGSLTGATCDIDQVQEFQVGGWWNFYKGEYGRMAFGASYAWLNVDTFTGTAAGTTGSSHGTNNIVMVSFRYYPF